MATRDTLSLLFERPTEPVFMEKGTDATVFQVPDSYLSDRYRPLGTALENRFGENAQKLTVKTIDLPNIDQAMQLGRRDHFSLFLPQHRIMAGNLIDVFLGMPALDDLQSAAVYCRDRVNPYLFNYALSVAMIHRQDTRTFPVPNFMETFPGKFFDKLAFEHAREELSVVPDGSRDPVIIPRNFSGTDLDAEHRVAYFREDIGINLHHWHWHLVYPFTANDRTLVAKDRRGELFYYMHHQIVARYNAERFSNRLNRVVPFNDVRAVIPEGYFPKLDTQVASRNWPPRFANSTLSDINRPDDGLRQDLASLERWRDRFISAIDQGFVSTPEGQQIPLTEQTGIDTLGNMMEASILTPNRELYGDLHNMGHLVIAYCHDPDGRFAEGASVMGDSATAMRDPIFYRWHTFVNNVFLRHKEILPRYTVNRLNYPGVTVTGLQVDVQGGKPNRLQTFWQQSDANLTRGLDFAPRGNVFARFTHLQHVPFTYRIQVNNQSGNQLPGTARIFMAPRNDERGIAMSFDEQRLMMIELDRFRVNLSQGQNMIVRRSDESSVTIPFDRTFRDLTTNRPANNAGAALEEFNFCGCGWPDHMLIPKGTEQGLLFDMFVMISNFVDDRIVQDINGVCNDADSFCGVRDRLYPDLRSMGYPFDRVGRTGVTTLTQFLTPNMRVQPVTITFTDRTVLRQQTPAQNI